MTPAQAASESCDRAGTAVGVREVSARSRGDGRLVKSNGLGPRAEVSRGRAGARRAAFSEKRGNGQADLAVFHFANAELTKASVTCGLRRRDRWKSPRPVNNAESQAPTGRRMPPRYDSILVVAFGGPERREDVIPFLENVLRGRNVPRERMLEVAEHYYHFGGVSPINAQVRELIAALRVELDRCGVDLPIYWGNRNWHPLLADTLREMASDGVGSTLAVVLSSYSSYSGCRQYRENIDEARCEIGEAAPRVAKVRVWYNHPDFIAANADRLSEAFERLPAAERDAARVAFTAHSIPCGMAETSDYVKQLNESCRLVAERLGVPPERWRLVYQSRSGRPQDPWLEPDVNDHLATLREEGATAVAVMPIGFLSDHMEVLYDLDDEARATAERLGLTMVRAGTVGTHPRFVSMLRESIVERMQEAPERRAVGRFGPNHDVCPVGCCPRPARPAPPAAAR